MIKTNGAEFKRFYNDDSTWPDGAWFEDEQLLVNGNFWELDTDAIPDEATVKLSGGVVLGLPDFSEPSVESYFRQWKKRQTLTTILVECDLSKLEEVKTAIKTAGGKVL